MAVTDFADRRRLDDLAKLAHEPTFYTAPVIESRVADMSTYVSDWDVGERHQALRECADLLRQLIGRVINLRLADASVTDLGEQLASALDSAASTAIRHRSRCRGPRCTRGSAQRTRSPPDAVPSRG